MTNSSTSSVQEFSRYEFKYVVNQKQREAVEAEIREFMQYDGHVSSELENQYLVRSLYFDSPLASNFYEKIDGLKTRRKFRIRTYTKDPDGIAPIFLEVKGRHNQRTYKQRVEIQKENLELFLDESKWPVLLEKYPLSPLVESFVYESVRKQIKPRVLVDYLRRPYTSYFDMNFRLTMDQEISSTPANGLFEDRPNLTRSCVAGWTIIEVKFNRRIPAWFHRILQAHELQRVSISKFVLGMKECGLAIDLS
jgi:hypothetical protein